MVKNFFTGFFLGIILKRSVIKLGINGLSILYNIKKNKTKNEKLSIEIFTKKNELLQKYSVDKPIEYIPVIEYLTKWKIPFGDDCEVFMYITYFINEIKYINVYTKESIVTETDFELHKNDMYSKIICVNFKNSKKTEYITKYFKSFLNNKNPLTAEMILLKNYTVSEDSTLIIVHPDSIKELKMKETI